MKLLFSSDWQTDEANLDYCATALEELEAQAAAVRPGVDAVILPGDLKEAYSPVSVRVVRFWIRAITRLSARHRVIVMMGNHDRISQSRRSAHWLSVMRAAGAEIVSRPKIKQMGGGYVGFLPFTADREQEKEWATQLAEGVPDGGTSVLVFHTEIMGVIPAAKGITQADLHADRWDYCVGGHVHEHQFIKPNIWYIGSPFTHSWGEANQTKGNLFLDTERGRPVQLRTAIPAWYDAEYLKANKLIPEAGALIRSRVEVTSKNITQQLYDEEARLERLYPDAHPHVIPKLVREVRDDELQLTGEDDEARVAQYVAATVPESVRWRPDASVTYLVNVLAQTKTQVRGGRLDFVRVTGKNVLSFPQVQADYRRQGIVLLRGVRRDWSRRSNGAGKSNLLNLIPVALFGQTLKGQKADNWAREQTGDMAELRLVMRDEKRRKIVVTRRRRPQAIELEVDGADISEGMRGVGRSETQGLIEKTCGFDMQLLTNSVYIDQTVANGFVFGTQKDRMDLVAKLQNLQRYEEALKIVTADIRKCETAAQALETAIVRQQEQMDGMTLALAELEREQAQADRAWGDKLAKAEKQLVQLVEQKSSLMGDEKMYEDFRTRISEWRGDIVQVDSRLTRYRAAMDAARQLQARAEKLIASGKCYVCGQPSAKAGEKFRSEAEATISEARVKAKQAEEERRAVNERIDLKEKSLARYDRELGSIEIEIANGRRLVREFQEAAEQEKKRAAQLKQKISDLKERLKTGRSELKKAQSEVAAQDIHREMLEYCRKAVMRGGIPLYLASTLCSFLNRAAAEYSEIFWESRIGVTFDVLDGEFAVSVINASGSETSMGQSMGETAAAGIVAAFALRDAAPKSNLLILDEPGSNLDPAGCRQFAEGLLRLKSRWQTIIVTTHSPVIESILAGEKTWTVQKKGRRSRLIV